MNSFIANGCKAAVKFFIIGAALALAAPYIGSVIGLAPTPAAASDELGKFGDPVRIGLGFAAVGALDALLKPLFKKLFAEKPAEKPAEHP